MATYLQGVTDFIPDYQPFEPDYNFYNTVLQAKQTQYDTNWKALNNVYGSIYNSQLTHSDNIAKKEDLLKQIDFNVKRISGLDLSLDQNVQQAMQVFKPFYEDQYLMKDMAWTKNFINRYGAAERLKTSQDEKQRSQYWGTGLKEMMYRREEFKNSTLDETLNFSDVTYTPYVNSIKKYLDMAKELGISADISTPPTGAAPYTIRQKNGDILLPTLNELFTATYANDPSLQRVYATQAYVNRKDYIYQNKDKFQGDELAAEKQYLNEQYTTLQKQVEALRSNSSENLTTTENKMAAVDNSYQNNGINFNSKSYLEMLQQGYETQKVIDNHLEKVNNEINEASSTSVTQGSTSGLDLNNMELARLKVDSVYANILAQEDILKAADAYSSIGEVTEYKVDPYYMEKVKDANARGRLRLAADLKEKQAIELKGVEDGIYEVDYTNGKIVRNQDGTPKLTPDYMPNGAGSMLSVISTDPQDILKSNEDFRQNKRTSLLSGSVEQTYNMIEALTTGSNPLMSPQEADYIITGVRKPTKPATTSEEFRNQFGSLAAIKNFINRSDLGTATSYKNFKKAYTEDKGALIKNLDDTDLVYGIQDRLANWMETNRGQGEGNNTPTIVAQYFTDPVYVQQRAQVLEYKLLDQVNDQIDKENESFITTGLINSLDQIQSSTGGFWNTLSLSAKAASKIKTLPPGQRIIYNMLGKGSDVSPELTGKEIELITNTAGHIEKLAKEFVKNPDMSEKEFTKFLQNYSVVENTERGPVRTYPLSFLALNNWAAEDSDDISGNDLFELFKDKYVKLSSSPQMKSYKGYKTIKTADGKTSIAYQTNGDKVNLKYMNLPGTKSFFQFVGDVNRINWNQPPEAGYKVSIGLTEDGDPIAAETISAAQLSPDKVLSVRNMLNDIMSKRGSKTKVSPFEIYSIDAGLEKPGLATMIVKLSPDILEEYTTKFDSDGNVSSPGYFTADEMSAIASGGIAFVAPKSTWTNDLYSRNILTPLEGVLNAQSDKTLIYTEPNGAGNIKISANPNDPNNYIVSTSIKAYDPQTGRVVQNEVLTPVYYNRGKKIDQILHETSMILMNQTQENLKYLREAKSSGNQELVNYLSDQFATNEPEFRFK